MLTNLLKTVSNPLTKFWGYLFLLVALGAGVASVKLYINKINYERERAVTRAESLSQDLRGLIEINNRNVDAFEKIAKAREQDQKMFLHLTDQIANLNADSVRQTNAIKQLEKTNAKVADYLNTRVPDDLARLLNDPAFDGHRDPGRKTAAPGSVSTHAP